MLAAVGALLVSFIFPLAIYFFLRNAHKENTEYKKDCTHISDNYPFVELVFRTFVLMAFSEELMKYLLLDESIIDTPWGGIALLLAFLCLVLNLYNFRFMSKARKKEYYTEPLFADGEGSDTE